MLNSLFSNIFYITRLDIGTAAFVLEPGDSTEMKSIEKDLEMQG